MPIDLCSSVSGVGNYAYSNSFLNTIMGSSYSVGFLVAFIMVLLIMIMYPAKKGTPFWVIGKMFVYMFFMATLVVFMHDGIVKNNQELQSKADHNHDFMNAITQKQSIYNHMHQPVETGVSVTGGNSMAGLAPYGGTEHVTGGIGYSGAPPIGGQSVHVATHTGGNGTVSSHVQTGGSTSHVGGLPTSGTLGGGYAPPQAGNPYK